MMWLEILDDEDPGCPCPPMPPPTSKRIAEAVAVATLSAIGAKAVEWLYDEIRTWMKRDG
jgi:hypothetical protein